MDKKNAVFEQTARRLGKLCAAPAPQLRSQLAELRRGVGQIPGDQPKLWGMLLENLPPEMLGSYGKPSKEEWAIFTSITLYALHQQGNDPKQRDMNQTKISMGKAAALLVQKDGNDDSAKERVSRRLNQIATASDLREMSYYLRSFVQLLRGKDIPLDYPMLADDIYRYQFSEGASSVRLKWGQDFYQDLYHEREERSDE